MIRVLISVQGNDYGTFSHQIGTDKGIPTGRVIDILEESSYSRRKCYVGDSKIMDSTTVPTLETSLVVTH